jgi:hypothetical protein
MPAVMSVATIDKPEFINIKPCNPLISECEIKVMYVGENRNKSYITKEVATKMANSLPGNPIVGYFREDVGDFRDHGDMVTIDHEGVHFQCMTRPYGFVSPDAKVWFQKFEETDEFGNVETREYLMTTGYLWTGQYPECKVAAEGSGRPHSMELDNDTLDGKWARNNKTGMDFFIINDAIFSKLCILGQDVEPCFEGSTVSAPNISSTFSKVDDDFTQTLYDMMQQLKFALKGEQNMIDEKNVQSSFATDKEEEVTIEFSEEKKEESKEEEVKKDFAKEEEEKKEEEKPADSEEEEKKEKFAKEEDEKEEKPASDEEDEEKKKFAKEEKEEDKEEKSSEDKKEEDEDEKKKFALLEEEHETLKANYAKLEEEYKELLAFKNQIEDEKKDALINSFYMLSDEDKAEVVENKSKFTLDEIEAKLSVICFRNKVNFDLDDNSKFENNKKEESPITTFNLESEVTSTPAWVSAVRNTQKSRNI